jgi:tetratricopeptide (TPR) repeat protein
MSTRLEKLQALLEQDPGNALVGYGLAQELAGLGRLDDAAAQYERLIAAKPDYCAAYFHGARTLEQLGRKDDARSLYRRGIETAARVGDEHARAEMQGALEALAL